MSKHGTRIKISKYFERRVRRQKRANSTQLTKLPGTWLGKQIPDIDADGFEPQGDGWLTISPVCDGYIRDRVRRKEHAVSKIQGRRSDRRRQNTAWKKTEGQE